MTSQPNIVLVLIDSLNRHMLNAYGFPGVQTPHLDAFARRATRFDRHFVGSLPCMPARRELFTGQKEFAWRPWGPLEPADPRLPRRLGARGYLTGIVTDHYHYWEEEANGYVQSFQTSELIRGHETDRWQARTAEDEPLPEWVQVIARYRPEEARQYYANVREFKDETDYFPAKVFTAANRWLAANARRSPFFLQVESFDVHEPFDVPEPYASLYADGKGRDRFNLWPPYQRPDDMRAFVEGASPEELDFVRAQYAAKLTMVDRWFGTLTETLDRLARWEDTVVIVTSDHGHDLAERGRYGKGYPHHDTHARIPLFVAHPDLPGGGTVDALTSTVDLFPTLLDLGGVPHPPHHGRSLLGPLRGEGNGRRGLTYGSFGRGVVCTDGEWTLMKAQQRTAPLHLYSSMIYRSLVSDSVKVPVDSGHFIPGVELPQWKVPVGDPGGGPDLLYHTAADPGQVTDLWEQAPEERTRMLALMESLLREEGAPEELFTRLGLASVQKTPSPLASQGPLQAAHPSLPPGERV